MCQLVHYQLISSQDLILVHIVQQKPTIKAQIAGRMITSGTNVVVFALVYLEKPRLKKLIIINHKKRWILAGTGNLLLL